MIGRMFRRKIDGALFEVKRVVEESGALIVEVAFPDDYTYRNIKYPASIFLTAFEAALSCDIDKAEERSSQITKEELADLMVIICREPDEGDRLHGITILTKLIGEVNV